MLAVNEQRIRSANQEILGEGDLAAVNEFFSGEYVLHSGNGEFKGIAFVLRFVSRLLLAMPDLEVVDVHFFMESGDTVVWQRTLRGTQKKDLMGIPPSGKQVQWLDMFVTRLDGGMIVEDWAASELAGQLVLNLP